MAKQTETSDSQLAASIWPFLAHSDVGSLPRSRFVRLKDETELLFIDEQPKSLMQTVFAIGEAPFQLSFHLFGHGEGELVYTHRRMKKVTIRTGLVLFSYNPGVTCTATLPAQKRFKVVNLYLKPTRLQRLFAGKVQGLPKEIHALVHGKVTEPFNLVCPMAVPCRRILEQIVTCPYQGCLGDMYLENKVLELLISQFSELVAEPRPRPPVRPGRVDAVHAARDILRENLENPPAVTELARQVGLCETYLKQGFRDIFGFSIHRYLNHCRLETAREMLCREEANVSDIACCLGFCDAAHFVRHFKAHFGVPPGVFAKTASNVSIKGVL
jgi:AraC-like DNA-binding protein